MRHTSALTTTPSMDLGAPVSLCFGLVFHSLYFSLSWKILSSRVIIGFKFYFLSFGECMFLNNLNIFSVFDFIFSSYLV